MRAEEWNQGSLGGGVEVWERSLVISTHSLFQNHLLLVCNNPQINGLDVTVFRNVASFETEFFEAT